LDYASIVETRLSKDDVHYLAQLLASKFDFQPESDIRNLVSLMGGEVVVEDMLLADPEQTKSLIVMAPENFQILVPSHTSPERDRFIVAHELGHYILHYLWQRKKNPQYPMAVVAYRESRKRLEWEANWFAAALLMPEPAFRNIYGVSGRNIRKIAAKFRVSVSAAKVRAKELRLELS
jgi:Zn-dependent peptidase ImmA (M78 family)